MNILLDILSSTFIGGIIMLMLFNLNVFQSNTRFASDSELQLHQNAKTLAEILNHDLRKAGYLYESTAFAQADSERISFHADIDRDGTTDIISFFLGDSSEAYQTTNPRDRILYRVVNNDTISGPSLGLIKAKFSYFDKNYSQTTILSDINYVKAELWVESIEQVNNNYLFTYWEMTINPRNL
jgi:hypothetical protein